MSTLLLLGDSHLALLPEACVRALGDACGAGAVVRAAVGGATSLDLAGQLDAQAADRPHAVVISVGSNDAAPGETHHVPLPDYRAALAGALRRLEGIGVVVLGSPPVDEARLETPGRTNSELAAYSAAAADVAARHGAAYVRTAHLLGSADGEVLVGDGLHLSENGYLALLPALVEALSG